MEEEIEVIPTSWAEIEQIETWVGEDVCEHNTTGGRARLTVTHYCGKDKKALIGQLETMIHSIKTNGEGFAS